jgi:hypothetical protein
MNLISDEKANAFGIFLFLVICFFAIISYAVTEPVMDGIDESFDEDYRNTYLTAEGRTTSNYIYDNLFKGGIIIIFIIICAAIMVINRAIRIGEIE